MTPPPNFPHQYPSFPTPERQHSEDQYHRYHVPSSQTSPSSYSPDYFPPTPNPEWQSHIPQAHGGWHSSVTERSNDTRNQYSPEFPAPRHANQDPPFFDPSSYNRNHNTSTQNYSGFQPSHAPPPPFPTTRSNTLPEGFHGQHDNSVRPPYNHPPASDPNSYTQSSYASSGYQYAVNQGGYGPPTQQLQASGLAAEYYDANHFARGNPPQPMHPTTSEPSSYHTNQSDEEDSLQKDNVKPRKNLLGRKNRNDNDTDRGNGSRPTAGAQTTTRPVAKPKPR